MLRGMGWTGPEEEGEGSQSKFKDVKPREGRLGARCPLSQFQRNFNHFFQGSNFCFLFGSSISPSYHISFLIIFLLLTIVPQV